MLMSGSRFIISTEILKFNIHGALIYPDFQSHRSRGKEYLNLKGEIELLFEYVKSYTKVWKMLINETCCNNKSFGWRELVEIDKSCKSSQP